MPLTYFSCPDGVRRPIADCLTKCPNKTGRCLSLPVLYEVSFNRPFTKPSVTQCINPTRMEYLKLTYNYSVDPLDRAFALLGTHVHKQLENVSKLIVSVKAEHRVEDVDTIGTLDLLEPDELNPGCWKLVDMKTWGSYSVAKVLGRKEGGESDLAKAALQLNGYRTKVEALNIRVSRMFIQAIVRDGGTYTAKSNGVPEKMLMIPIDRMPDDVVIKYFNQKANALIAALNSKALPAMCGYEDTWASRRCKEYCEVNAFCPEGAALARIEYQKENGD